MPNLTPKQEAFCRAYVETGNASEAYRRAYNVSRMKPHTIEVKASELLKHGEVSVRIAELTAATAKRADLTVDDVVQGLLAITKELKAPASARVAAWAQLSKYTGGFIDRRALTIEDRTEVEELAAELGLPVDEIMAEAESILKAGRK